MKVEQFKKFAEAVRWTLQTQGQDYLDDVHWQRLVQMMDDVSSSDVVSGLTFNEFKQFVTGLIIGYKNNNCRNKKQELTNLFFKKLDEIGEEEKKVKLDELFPNRREPITQPTPWYPTNPSPFWYDNGTGGRPPYRLTDTTTWCDSSRAESDADANITFGSFVDYNTYTCKWDHNTGALTLLGDENE